MPITDLGTVRGPEGPEGKQGVQGLAGVNAVANDTATANYLDPAVTSATRTAADALYGPGRILCIGSSIAAGWGVTNMETDSYPARTGFYLSAWLDGVPVTVINAGVAGDTTSLMRARLAALLAQHRPSYVVIELSINDVALTVGVSAATTIGNMTAMAAMARLAGAVPIFTTHQPLNPAQANAPTLQTQATQALATQNRLNIIALGTSLGVLVADVFTSTRHAVDTMSDGIHPSDHGADIWGHTIAQVIYQHAFDTSQTATLFSDDFARTSTTTAGPLWSALDGAVWGDDGSNAYWVSGGGDGDMVIATGATDVDFTSELTWTSGVPEGGILVRSDGTRRGYLLQPSAGNLMLYALTTGAATVLGTIPADLTAGATLQLNVSGPNLLAWLNDAPVLSAVDSTWPTGDRVALRLGANAGARWGSAVARA